MKTDVKIRTKVLRIIAIPALLGAALVLPTSAAASAAPASSSYFVGVHHSMCDSMVM